MYLEHNELLLAGIPHRTALRLPKVPHPADNRANLYPFEELSTKYQQLITMTYGDPYLAQGTNTLRAHITTCTDSLDTLTNHRLQDGKSLTKTHIREYSKACNYLAFLDRTDKRMAKSYGFTSQQEFYEAVINLIRQDGVRLPLNYSRLRQAVRRFRDGGALAIIDSRHCNSNSKKVDDEVAEAVLLKLLKHPHQFGDIHIAKTYNEWAEKAGRKTITETTVGNYRRRHDLQIAAFREGTGQWRDKYDQVIKRTRPSSPLLLINSDDNVLDLYFIRTKQNKKGTNITDYYYRPTLYVVIDAFNNYPLGYAIGDTATKDLVREAYLNAIHHIHQLTGSWYLWHQIVADRWGLKSEELLNFFEQQATFTPAKFSNARSKVIEQSFGTNWHNTLKLYRNYAGHNITAKKSLNREALELNKKSFPLVDEMADQVADFINRLRTQPGKNGLSKQQEWLQAWSETPAAKQRTLSSEQRLMLFGKKHSHNNRISNRGLEFTINGHRMSFDVQPDDYVNLVGTTGHVIYDPYMMGQVMYEKADGSYRALCTATQEMPMALADFGDGDRTRLNQMLATKKQISQRMLEQDKKQQELLDRAGIDAQSMLQAGVLVKADRILAEKSAKGSTSDDWNEDDDDIDILDRL